MPLHVSSIVVLIIRRSKLYYTVSGIITPVGGRPVHRLREDSLGIILVIPQHVSSTILLITRRSKFYYTESGIVTPVGGQCSLNLRTGRPHIAVTIPDAV